MYREFIQTSNRIVIYMGCLFFQMASNPFDSEGAMAILEGVDLNDSCELTLLDLSVSIQCGSLFCSYFDIQSLWLDHHRDPLKLDLVASRLYSDFNEMFGLSYDGLNSVSVSISSGINSAPVSISSGINRSNVLQLTHQRSYVLVHFT